MNSCDTCSLAAVCLARITIDDLAQKFKYLAMTEAEKESCEVTHTFADVVGAMGGACTAYKPEGK